VSTFLESIKDARAKREAARQYVMAADRFREMARDERKAERDGTELERIASNLIRNASYELIES
jgi:hypothetical protein